MKKLITFAALLLALTPVVARADVQQATPVGGPTWSSIPTAVDSFASGSRTDIVVSWNAANANGNTITGYQVVAFASDVTGSTQTRSTVSCSTDGSGTSCTLKGLAWATYYKFVVLATNSVATTSSDYTTNTQLFPSRSGHPVTILTPGIAQTVTITGTPTSYTFGSADFKLDATATSGLPITWSTSDPTICTVDATGVVHFLKAQISCAITATQYGASAGYNVASASVNVTAGIDLSATANAASAVQGTAATLNGVFPYPGANVTPSFCVSATNPGGTAPTSCASPAGTVGTLSTTLITATSSTTSSATVTGLLSAHTYYYWAIATSGSNKAASNVISFTTLEGPTLTYTGSLNGTVGTPMTVTFTASGGSGVYAAWDKGPLPVGLSITYTDKTAVVSGTPTSTGSVLTWVYVEDSGGLNTNLPVTYVISAASGGTGGGGGGGGGSIPSVLPTPSPTPVPTTTPTAPVVLPSPSAAPTPRPSVTPTPRPTQAVPQPLPSPARPTPPSPTTPRPTTPNAPAPTPSKSTAPVPTPSAGPAPLPGTAPVKKPNDVTTETVKSDGVETQNAASFPLQGANTTLRIRSFIQKLVP